MNDRQRITYLSELLKLPTASISYNDDDESGAAPSGFTIRVEAACLPELAVTAQTFRDAVDKFKWAADKQARTDVIDDIPAHD